MCMPVYYSWPIPKQWSSLMLALWLNKATIGWKYQRTKSISHSQWTVVLIFTVDLTGFRITISGCVCDAIPRKVWLRREDSGHGQHYLNDWGPGLNPKERASVLCTSIHACFLTADTKWPPAALFLPWCSASPQTVNKPFCLQVTFC